ncbi:E1-E2 ATPase-domain-containing protein [Nemania abortiva]|nr:E1-E2 ATPase-domain-containing protein [Nemania abortiva]
MAEDISESKPSDSWKGIKTALPSSDYAAFDRMVQDGTIKGLTDDRRQTAYEFDNRDTDQVAQIRSKYGTNESTHGRNGFNLRSFGASVAAQSVVIAIAIPTLASVAEGRWIGFAVVYPLLLSRAIFAVYSEISARGSVALMKQTTSISTPTLRNGVIDNVNASEIVPGDIMRLSEDRPVFADGKILAADESFTVSETLVPGGSRETIRKRREDILHASSVVKSGQAFVIVSAIGNKRRDACPLDVQTSPPIHHNEILDKTFKVGTVLAACVILLTWVSVFYHYRYLAPSRVEELLRSSFSILLVGVPIGLLATVFNCLVRAALFLGAVNGCLVRRFSVIEDLAGVDTLCCDYTGTFTRIELQAMEPWPATGSVTPEDVLISAGLATSRSAKEHDAIDRAVLQAIRDRHPDAEAEFFQYRKEKFFPFDTRSKPASSIVRTPKGETWAYCKGAPLFVLQAVTNNSQNPFLETAIQRYRDALAQITKSGYQCIGVVRNKCTADGAILAGHSEILGLIPFVALPRPDSWQRVVDIKQYGLNIKTFSASAQPVVERASYKFGLGTTVYHMDIEDLLTSSKTPGDFERGQRMFSDRIKDADAFSEVFSRHKFNVVHSLENNGRRVAVTTDSADDCFTLRRATVGIAIAGASDSARAVTDIVYNNQSVGLGPIAETIRTSRSFFNILLMQILYRIAVACHTLICFAGWALQYIGRKGGCRVEMLDVNLVVLIVLFSDFFASVVGLDHTLSSYTQLSWSRSITFKKVTTPVAILVFWTCITMATIPAHSQEDAVSTTERNIEAILFLQIVLSQSVLLLLIRPSPIWIVKPTKAFSACIMSVNLLATMVCYAWGSLGQGRLGSNAMLAWDIVYVWKISFGLLCVTIGVYNLGGYTQHRVVLPKLNVTSFVK